MVAYSFDARGFDFQLGIFEIKETFHACKRAIEARAADHLAELERQEANPVYPPDFVYGEDMPPDYILRYKIDKDRSALKTVRESFLLVLFHHWERSFQIWTGNDNATFNEGCNWIRKEGIELDETRMQQLRRLVNTVKHNKAAKLFELRPEFFPSGIPLHSCLVISDDHMEEFFEAVSRSGVQEDGVKIAWGTEV